MISTIDQLKTPYESNEWYWKAEGVHDSIKIYAHDLKYSIQQCLDRHRTLQDNRLNANTSFEEPEDVEETKSKERL